MCRHMTRHGGANGGAALSTKQLAECPIMLISVFLQCLTAGHPIFDHNDLFSSSIGLQYLRRNPSNAQCLVTRHIFEISDVEKQLESLLTSDFSHATACAELYFRLIATPR